MSATSTPATLSKGMIRIQDSGFRNTFRFKASTRRRTSDDRAMANPDRELERKFLGEKIKAALDTLTPRERMVFELKHYQGLRLRTIGEMLNTTEETAKNTLFRATRKLRANLAAIR